jgi:hypothetical protein
MCLLGVQPLSSSASQYKLCITQLGIGFPPVELDRRCSMRKKCQQQKSEKIEGATIIKDEKFFKVPFGKACESVWESLFYLIGLRLP